MYYEFQKTKQTLKQHCLIPCVRSTFLCFHEEFKEEYLKVSDVLGPFKTVEKYDLSCKWITISQSTNSKTILKLIPLFAKRLSALCFHNKFT